MKWRIRESELGGFIVEKGIEIKGGTEVGYKLGCYMPAFIVYDYARFDTRQQAKEYIKSH